MTKAQQIFVAEYLINGQNGCAAYQLAYPNASSESARRQASWLLKHHKEVRKTVVAKLGQTFKKYDVTIESIVQELACIAYVDPEDYYDDEGNLIPIKDLPENARRAIQSFEVSVDKTTFKYHDSFEGETDTTEVTKTYIKKQKNESKTKALEILAKYRKMLTDKLDINANVSHTIVDLLDQDLKQGMEGKVSKSEPVSEVVNTVDDMDDDDFLT